MKPLGMSCGLKVIMPSRAEDAIWNAVQEAISAGMTAKQFRNEIAQAWEQESKDKLKSDLLDLSK